MFPLARITEERDRGVGTALTVPVDATIIRVVLLPVSVRPAGRANRWAPKPPRTPHARFGPSVTPGAPGGPYSAGSTSDHHVRLTPGAPPPV
ncbi:hypothetical protein [Streptomyces sp. NPDC091212]|uniref:hypothetical protein n=1 Tax=Streptomyces sp. NPDC091212 TaxID=3155191 RepID=UPI00344607E5